MTATIFIDRLRVHALIGVDAQERIVGNDFDITVYVDYPAAVDAGKHDALEQTINYAGIADVIRQTVSQPMLLVEHAAWLIAERLQQQWPGITGGSVEIKKIAPPVEGAQCKGMGVTFRWSK